MSGDAAPTILTATDLVVRFNDRVLLNRATLAIHEGERIGLVGRNGAGKSTLLRILTGELLPDGGDLSRRRDLVIGYLPQQVTLDPSLSVEANIRAGARHVLDLLHEFESLPALSSRHEEVEQRIRHYDGWGLDHRIAGAMSRLHCPAPDRDVATLSGGEKRRVALCRALISQPDLLILDEPTNHLDNESIEWLGEFLQSFPGALLLVTHDRCFLDQITGSIVELSQGTFYAYTGNYTDYLLAKTQREAVAEVNEHRRQMFLRRELEWVRRGPKAQTTKSKSRLERFEAIAGQEVPVLDGEIELVLPPPPPLGNRVVDLFNVGVTLGDHTLFSSLNFKFRQGQRVGVTGRNGLGKTTLLKVILGQLPPTTGEVKTGELTRFNFLDQGRLLLDDERTVLEEISDGSEFVMFGNHRLSLRGYLKRFLFTDDRISSQVKYLSGGERSRLLLARILKHGGNFLVLDEPTNDLDLPTLRILEEALASFPGVVLVVSHDRYFLNRVCTDILAFEGQGHVAHSVGDYDYYLEKRRRIDAARRVAAAKETAPTARPARDASSPKPRKLTYKERLEWEGIEQKIQEAEAEVERIEALFADPGFHVKHGPNTPALMAELETAKQTVAGLYARWEELESLREPSP